MPLKSTPPTKTPPAERRSGDDRRSADAAPPTYDRRRGIESRLPEVVELELSPSDWAAFSAAMPLRTQNRSPGGS
jgi:hypothetical protein